jgi:hypothetical protein
MDVLPFVDPSGYCAACHDVCVVGVRGHEQDSPSGGALILCGHRLRPPPPAGDPVSFFRIMPPGFSETFRHPGGSRLDFLRYQRRREQALSGVMPD